MSTSSDRARRITGRIYKTRKYLAVEIVLLLAVVAGLFLVFSHHSVPAMVILLVALALNVMLRRHVAKEIDWTT